MPDRADSVWADMVRRHTEFAAGRTTSADLPEHRPRAAVLACSDARVPPSILFDQEPGSLFVVRLAGNSATPGAIASLTYAVEQLGTELVVVLGHTGCGAVSAALEAPAEPSSDFTPILTPIDEMLAACDHCNSLEAAVAANVSHNVGRLERDRGPLGRAVAAGDVTVRGAVHDLASGRLLDPASNDPAGTSAPTPATTTTTPTPIRSTP